MAAISRSGLANNPSETLLPDIAGNDSNLLIVFYVQIMPDDLVM
ncbi:GntR family transcriptional regulator, partial [Shigella flexneri]